MQSVKLIQSQTIINCMYKNLQTKKEIKQHSLPPQKKSTPYSFRVVFFALVWFSFLTNSKVFLLSIQIILILHLKCMLFNKITSYPLSDISFLLFPTFSKPLV